ncbi:MAG: site-specific DNA-methyltransferase [Phycisphaerales bacterium]|nr:site-specific DNA-methyltransferase [Phycisphaerales bacterium]
MPTLTWTGKEAVVNHHRNVPYRLLHCDKSRSAGDADSGNLLVQGDNLEALKALLPYYAGKVKCIYIDPPYNTGNENWIYNDNVNSPQIKKWLGQVVGKEAEDLTRHDKWLCMMYPRLALLREFLSEDGAIFVSLDDNEIHSLRYVMDEIFGGSNFISTIIWQKNFSPNNSAKHLSESHDYVALYAKHASPWRPNLLTRSEGADARYTNPDDDPRGPWTSSDLTARNYYSLGTYSVTCPSGRVIAGPARGRYWSVSEENMNALRTDNRVWFGANGNNMPRLKRFRSEVQEGIVPQTIWMHSEVGNTQEAKKELVAVVDFNSSDDVFITPKPTRLMQRVFEIAADSTSLILDSFAGSGTTGHAVLQMNKADGGNRRFICIEMDETIARDVTSQRLRKVVEGYTNAKGQAVEGLGGGFRFCTLGKPLFDEFGSIDPDVKFSELAAHVFFSETGSPLPKRRPPPHPSPGVPGEGALLGVFEGRAVYLLFNGILGDKKPNGGNVLTGAVLESLPGHDGPKVIYGEACRLGETRLKAANITFKQVPWEVRAG